MSHENSPVNENKPPSTAGGEPPGKKVVMQVYAAFAVSLILCTLPYTTAAVVCMIFLLGVLLAAYIIRWRADKDSFCHNHMTYIIRTIWISGLFASVTTAAGGAYLIAYVDNAPLSNCIDMFLGISPDKAASMSGLQAMEYFDPCMENFISTNWQVLMVSMAISAGPIMLYLLYRFVTGISRAMKGYRVAQPQAWF